MRRIALVAFLLALSPALATAQRTQKPPLHAQHWMAITGKPLAATAGATIFQQGGNAVDAICAAALTAFVAEIPWVTPNRLTLVCFLARLAAAWLYACGRSDSKNQCPAPW